VDTTHKTMSRSRLPNLLTKYTPRGISNQASGSVRAEQASYGLFRWKRDEDDGAAVSVFNLEDGDNVVLKSSAPKMGETWQSKKLHLFVPVNYEHILNL
jgi:hypothetical protein